MRTGRWVAADFAVFAAAGSVTAHHSITAVLDTSKKLKLSVTEEPLLESPICIDDHGHRLTNSDHYTQR